MTITSPPYIFNFAFILCLAILFDFVAGDNKSFPHPVNFVGNLIIFLHSRFFHDIDSLIQGLLLCIITLFITGFAIFLVLYASNYNILVQIYLLYSAIAWRDLKDETIIIFQYLLNHDINNARKYLSFVVGRDTENLNETEITRAVIETISENSIDGVISVMFFAALGYVFNHSFGMALFTWLFKASSTLDSIIGYRKYCKLGYFSAKLDDVLNFIPARLGGIVIIISGFFMNCGVIHAFRIFLHDRKNHESPNSAHGESAFAGVLGVILGGGAYYNGIFESRGYINSSARDPEIYDILRAYKLLDISCALFALLIILFSWKI